MKVSVVIPCFNERDTIEQVVNSVRNSPIQNIEIIVVDDGSTDGTIDVLKEKVRGAGRSNHLSTGKAREGSSLAHWFCRSNRRHHSRAGRRPRIQPERLSCAAPAHFFRQRRRGFRFAFSRGPTSSGPLFLAHGRQSFFNAVFQHVYESAPHRSGKLLQSFPCAASQEFGSSRERFWFRAGN